MSGPSLDVDIYEYVIQTSQSQIIQVVLGIDLFSQKHVSNPKVPVYCKKLYILNKRIHIFEAIWMRDVCHTFYKCPHPVKALIPSFENLK